MKVSYNWLKEYVEIKESPNELANILTQLGLEVEGVETFSSIQGGLKGFIIGEVISCEKHPNADKLKNTKVNIGQEENLSIVCGAPNVEAGQKVIVATIGTTIYTDNGNFEIKKSKIRGEVSEGMICAKDEIGIGTSHDGILVLPNDAIVGTAASEYFKIENDNVLEVDLTPNRIDAASHIGIARDYAAFKNIEYKLAENPKLNKIDSPFKIEIEVENLEACPRYSGICLDNIKVEESPDWLKNRLKAIGLNPINNIVDITNYVLHETGQPLHAFDGDKIKGNKIIVKPAKENSKFTTLDNIERTLNSDNLMICNAEEPMCIAGVLGGLDSGISQETKKVFLESAHFNTVWIRKTAKHHTINTDSSFRFERGTDVNMTIYALNRAASLIEEINAGKVCSEITDIYPNPIPLNTINFNIQRCNNLIGKDIPQSEIENILKNLEINIKERKDKDLIIEIPSYRFDVYREVDVIEDILRIYGYNNVSLPQKLSISLNKEDRLNNEKLTNTTSDLLVSNGFNEIICNSLTSSKYFDLENNKTIVELQNPLSKDLNVMRPSPIHKGLESIAYNINRKIVDIKFFEFGRTYHAKENNDNISDINRYYERNFLAMWISGKKNILSWNLKDNPSDFFTLKSYTNLILEKLGIKLDYLKSEIETDKDYKYSLSYYLNSKPVLKIGLLSNEILKMFDIAQDVFYAEIDWDLIKSNIKTVNVRYTPISKFPKVKRDLALLVDKRSSYKQLIDIAFKTVPSYLKDVNLFDIYEGKNIEEGKISCAISYIFEDSEKTMTDKQIDKIMSKLIDVYTKEFNAILR